MTNQTLQTVQILTPVSTIEKIDEQFKLYEKLKQSLLSKEDLISIRGKHYIKKSGYRKLATAFGISTEVLNENKEQTDSCFVRHITVKAIAPNGRFTTCCASCASNEKKFTHLENDVRATAQTRATNRAISDLIGAGEVSAEEIYKDDASLSKNQKHIPISSEGYTHGEPQDLITLAQQKFLKGLLKKKYSGKELDDLLQKMPTLTKQEAQGVIKRLANLDQVYS